MPLLLASDSCSQASLPQVFLFMSGLRRLVEEGCTLACHSAFYHGCTVSVYYHLASRQGSEDFGMCVGK